MKKYALVTGATSGIGYELARCLARDGFNLVLVARNELRLNQIKANFEEEFKVSVKILPKDLSIPNAAFEIYGELETEEIKLNVLVNNAGFGVFGAFTGSSWGKESEMIQVNIAALTHLCKLFARDMSRREGGQILNVASTAAFFPGPLMSVYYATKAYVVSFSEAIRDEFRGTGVTVTVLCPGPTKTGFQKAAGLENSGLVKDRKMPSAEEVAVYGYHAMLQGKTTAVHGFWNRIFVLLGKFLPRTLLARAVRKIQENKVEIKK
jgi:short-subunit dehydrogenase